MKKFEKFLESFDLELLGMVAGQSSPAITTPTEDTSKQAIIQLVSKAFATRNLLHFEHWSTKSYAQHIALNELYDQIVGDIDEIVEVYQGKYGLIMTLSTEYAQLPVDIITRIKEEASWVEVNKGMISKGDPAIGNLIDNLLGDYHKTVYKLENLH